MKIAATLLAPLALLGSALPASAVMPVTPPAARGMSYAKLGETVRIRNLAVTPLRVLEDSRCPAGVACVWAGRLRLSVRIGSAVRELTLGQGVPVAGGTLLLASADPRSERGAPIAPRSYRFGFRLTAANGGVQLIRY